MLWLLEIWIVRRSDEAHIGCAHRARMSAANQPIENYGVIGNMRRAALVGFCAAP
jgi:hypothetical protein